MKTTKQHTLWLLAALAAPMAHASGSGWLTTALAALTILPLSLIPKDWEGLSKSSGIIQSVWLGLVAGALLSNAAAVWPSDNRLAVPLTLLALAAFTSKGAAPRIGAVLALCMALLTIPVAIRGAIELEPQCLRPQVTSWPWALSLIFLIPNLPLASKGGEGGIWKTGAAAVILSVLTQGVIGLKMAFLADDPFYQTARSLGYLEPIAAVMMTLGWYCTAVFLMENARMFQQNANVFVLSTLITVLLGKVQLHHPIMTVLSAFLWVFSPFWTKMKKVEKT